MNAHTLTAAERQQLVDRFYWYHTIDLGDGVVSRGVVNHADAFSRYGFPSVAGRSVLDVATGDGYFAFQFERLGADRVVAVDIDRLNALSDLDAPARTRARRRRKYLPFAGQEEERALRERTARDLGLPSPTPFQLARLLRRSTVQFQYQTIYDLAALNEQFDLVFVGTVTDGLQDLTAAFEAVRAVTRHQAVIACADLLDSQPRTGWRRLAYHGVRALSAAAGLHDDFPSARERPVALYTANDGGSIWRPSVACIRELLLSAGFRDVDVFSRFALDNLRHGSKMKHVTFHAFV